MRGALSRSQKRRNLFATPIMKVFRGSKSHIHSIKLLDDTLQIYTFKKPKIRTKGLLIKINKIIMWLCTCGLASHDSTGTKTGSFSITKNSFACSTFTIDHWKMAADTRFDLWNHSSLITVTASITFSMTTESFDGSRFSSLRLLFTWICLLVFDHQVEKL